MLDHAKNNLQILQRKSPTPLVVEHLSRGSHGKVLDAGAGDGRNAIYLAKRGWQVVALDPNAQQCQILSSYASQHHLGIDCVTNVLETFKTADRFDAVVCNMVLHFMTKATAHRAIATMKAMSNPGAIHIVTAFTDHNPPKCRPYLFGRTELAEQYHDWDVKHYEVGQSTPVKDKDGHEQQFEVVRLVAQLGKGMRNARSIRQV